MFFPCAALLEVEELLAWVEAFPVVESLLNSLTGWKNDLDLLVEYMDEFLFTNLHSFLELSLLIVAFLDFIRYAKWCVVPANST